eukprot:Blabericola_migrator_1__6732@NODE_33_length_18162_cov_161_418900_g29_i0_p10_GENE_NODE_33_length_18162_cov_161_418900_g29_i0NODE_33_length_18162_cov_161_418900_g29_i0_p10_ORF_typecomplete_len234_score20_56_NODE_33_length_18162_cov_161_418900_g29_i01745918133
MKALRIKPHQNRYESLGLTLQACQIFINVTGCHNAPPIVQYTQQPLVEQSVIHNSAPIVQHTQQPPVEQFVVSGQLSGQPPIYQYYVQQPGDQVMFMEQPSAQAFHNEHQPVSVPLKQVQQPPAVSQAVAQDEPQITQPQGDASPQAIKTPLTASQVNLPRRTRTVFRTRVRVRGRSTRMPFVTIAMPPKASGISAYEITTTPNMRTAWASAFASGGAVAAAAA